jgi:hypothetical protein
LNDDDAADIRQLIDSMQSGLVELFDQLRELRNRLSLLSGLPTGASPSVMSLFSEVKQSTDKSDSTLESESFESSKNEENNDVLFERSQESKPDSLSEADMNAPTESITSSIDTSSANAKVSRVLDPIVRELKTGEATADIVLEYLQAAKDYLIDDDERKKKVARDMDIVLNFLKARGKRGIRTEERDNILKRIRRWKAHLVSYSDSPAEKA